jgi:hypothetical protein
MLNFLRGPGRRRNRGSNDALVVICRHLGEK